MLKRVGVILLSVVWAVGVCCGLGYFIYLQNLPDPSLGLTDPTGTNPTQGPVVDFTDPSGQPVTFPTLSPEELYGPPTPVFLPEDYAPTYRYAFSYDAASQQVVMGQNGLDTKLYPASITKLFTAYVALQYLDPETVLTAAAEQDFVEWDSSIAGIQRGQSLKVEDLISGMLLPSGNDAAYMLAAGAGRVAASNSDLTAAQAVARFVEAMNEHAQLLGLTGSHFTNPDGYHDSNHYTTGRDLIRIAQLSLEDPLIRTCASTRMDMVTYESGQTATWVNTNALIQPESPYYCPEAKGLKTGFTSAAGNCLLCAFQVQGRYIIVGIFGCEVSEDRFTDALYVYSQTVFQ